MKLRINSTTYEIPTSWSTVKYIDFANSKTQGLPLEKKLSYQTGIPSEVILNLQAGQLSKILSAIDYQDKLPEFFDEFHSELNVGNEHYIKLEQARQAFTQGNQWLAAIEIVRIYTEVKEDKEKGIEKSWVDISQMPTPKGMGYAAFFLTRLESLLRDTKPLESTSQTKTSTQQE